MVFQETRKLSIAHIVNPFIVSESSDLFTAQPITFESMRIAQEFVKDKVDVNLFSANYKEDDAFVPKYLKNTRNLVSSTLNYPNKRFTKKLPFIKDILNNLYESSDADYFIYTNVDIGLMDNFYLAVSDFINKGYDAFSITRRTIPACYKAVSDLPLIYNDYGKPHLGWDCFVFRRELYPNFKLGNVFIGAPGVGRVLLCNMTRFGDQFACFNDEHLTFHIGEDGGWMNKGNNSSATTNLNQTNRAESLNIIKLLYKEAQNDDRKALLKKHLDTLTMVHYPWRKLFYRILRKKFDYYRLE